MEWLMRQSGQKLPKIKRILELNPSHEVVGKLKDLYAKNAYDPLIKDVTKLLYGQAVLAEGGQLSEPAEFAKLVVAVTGRAI
jgi:molecular chaperone HtpG